VIGFGHRPTAITILDRATPVLDRWPVGPLQFVKSASIGRAARPLLLMTRRPPFPESLGELVLPVQPASLFTSTWLSTLASTAESFAWNVGRSGNCHPIASFWLYIRVAYHAEHILERCQPIRRGLVGEFTGLAVRRSRFASGSCTPAAMTVGHLDIS
jgi:hypothetical protein